MASPGEVLRCDAGLLCPKNNADSKQVVWKMLDFLPVPAGIDTVLCCGVGSGDAVL